ncbi:MAG: hypothetical protein ACXWTK_03580 [Methylobacter sp.]
MGNAKFQDQHDNGLSRTNTGTTDYAGNLDIQHLHLTLDAENGAKYLLFIKKKEADALLCFNRYKLRHWHSYRSSPPG